MNDDKDTNQRPPLRSLVKQYQEIKAPLGFAERVAAQVNDKAASPAWFSSPWLYAASFAVVAMVAVTVVLQMRETEPELQIAQPDKSTQNQNPPVESAPSGDARPKPEEIRIAKHQQPPPPQPDRAKQNLPAYQPDNQQTAGGGYSNLAVLSDVSDWLALEESIAVPDFSDLPPLSEIDGLSDAT